MPILQIGRVFSLQSYRCQPQALPHLSMPTRRTSSHHTYTYDMYMWRLFAGIPRFMSLWQQRWWTKRS